MKKLLAAMLMLGGLTVVPDYALAQPADSKAQIEQVIESFRMCQDPPGYRRAF